MNIVKLIKDLETVNKKAHRFANLFRSFEKLESETEKIMEESSIEEFENADAEWMCAYKKEFEAKCILVDYMVDFLEIDRNTARTMLSTKRDEIRNLVNRLA